MDDSNIGILGGGISGLSLAWYLQKVFSPSQITVYEKAKRAGGVIATACEGRFFFERGPRTFCVGRCPELLSLIEEVGLKDELIFARPQKRYIYYKGQLRSLQSMALKGLFYGAWRDLWAPKKMDDETIRAFGLRRFGRWATDYVMDPVTLGVYAGSIDELSIERCFGWLKTAEKCYGSVIKALRKRPKRDLRLFTLKGGMQKLIEALSERVQIEYGKEPEDVMYTTIPQPEHIEYAALTVVHMGFEEAVLKKKGFGYLVPSCYGMDVLGVVFDSCVFPQQNRTENETRISVMLKPCAEPVEKAMEVVRNHLGITRFAHEVMVSNYPQAVPQMVLGHREKIDKMQKESRAILAGSYVAGPAVNTCIKQAQMLAEQAFSRVFQSAPVCV